MTVRSQLAAAFEAVGAEHPECRSFLRDCAGAVLAREDLDDHREAAVRIERWYDQDHDGGQLVMDWLESIEPDFLDLASDPDEAAAALAEQGFYDMSDASQPMVHVLIALRHVRPLASPVEQLTLGQRLATPRARQTDDVSS